MTDSPSTQPESDAAVLSEDEFRSLQVDQLRTAVLDVAQKIDVVDVAIMEIDDAIDSLNKIENDLKPRQPNMDEPTEPGRLLDLDDLPLATRNTLSGRALGDKPLRVERAALVVYLDALRTYEHRLIHIGQEHDIDGTDLFPEVFADDEGQKTDGAAEGV